MLQTSTMQPPTIDDIRAAAERINGAVIRTPMLVSRTLSEIIGAEVWLKFENLQFTAAYKERGALNKLIQLSAEERARGVIAALLATIACPSTRSSTTGRSLATESRSAAVGKRLSGQSSWFQPWPMIQRVSGWPRA